MIRAALLAILLSGCAFFDERLFMDRLSLDKLETGTEACKPHGGLRYIADTPGRPREFVIHCKDGTKYVPTFMFFRFYPESK